MRPALEFLLEAICFLAGMIILMANHAPTWGWGLMLMLCAHEALSHTRARPYWQATIDHLLSE